MLLYVIVRYLSFFLVTYVCKLIDHAVELNRAQGYLPL